MTFKVLFIIVNKKTVTKKNYQNYHIIIFVYKNKRSY